VVAYAYLRKSVLPPGSTSMSPEAQQDSVRSLAKVHNDEADIVILADWDISGTDKFTAKRKGWAELNEAIESGVCTAVYSYSLSRLARSTKEALRFFESCKEHRVTVRLVADAIDTKTASGTMLLTVMTAVDQFGSDVASERRLASNDAKRARGIAIVTDTPFGRKAPCPEECTKKHRHTGFEDVKAVVEAFRATRSFTAAAKRLNEAGVRPRRADAWVTSSVLKVIHANAPELIAPKTVKRVAAGGQPFALARLLRCGTCGGMLTGRHGYRGRAQYYCARAGVTPHPRAVISEHLIIPAVIAEVEKSRDVMKRIEQRGDPGARKSIVAARERLNDAYFNPEPIIDKATYTKRLRDLADRESRIESRRILHITRFPVFVDTIDPEDGETVPADPPASINVFLRRLFDHIDVDAATMQPTCFEWTVEDMKPTG